MKYLVSLFLFTVPLLTSCNVQEEYYEEGYYNPPPRVEVAPRYSRHYHQQGGYRPAPNGRVYHGHAQGGPVVVGPRDPRPQMGMQQNNVHGHNGTVHSHPGNNVNQRPQAEVQQNVHGHEEVQDNVHGHDDANAVRAARNSSAQLPVRRNTHGHN